MGLTDNCRRRRAAEGRGVRRGKLLRGIRPILCKMRGGFLQDVLGPLVVALPESSAARAARRWSSGATRRIISPENGF